MEKIDEQLNSLSLTEVPIGTHQFIMHKVNYQRIKPMLFSILAILAFNFLLTAWHINSKLVDAEFSDMMYDFFDGFVLSFSFISTILESFFEIISPIIFVSFLLNLIGIIYMANKIKKTFNYKIRFETN